MTWIEFGLLALKLALALLDKAKERQQFNEGYESAVMDTTKKIQGMTARGKVIWEKVDAMSDDDLTGVESQLGGQG